MPKVSVITPTFNRPELLAQAIGSVLAQTFTDFEMLVVDDGSEPDAQPVVEQFGDERVKFIRQQKAGRSAARNLGLQAARGKFIAFLDDDDLYWPEKLAHESKFLDSHPDIDIVSSGWWMLKKADIAFAVNKPWVHKPVLAAENCLFSTPMATCAVLFRRIALNRMDHWFDPQIDMAEDTDFFLRLLLSGARHTWLEEVLSDYRLLDERPMAVLMDIHKAYRKVYEKIFQRADLPPEIAAQRRDVMLHHTLNGAWQAYAYQLNTLAQRYLLRALIMEPRLADEQEFMLIKGISTTAQKTLYLMDAGEYIDYVLDHLPAPLRHLASQREEIKRLFYEPATKAENTPHLHNGV